MTVPNLGQRYQVKTQLGKQTGRQTVLALDLKTQEFVVIKLLSLGAGFDWQDLKLFEREAETLKNLSHPAIPRYLDYQSGDRHLALVQTYVEAKSLEQHLKAGRTFAEAEVKALARSLLEILTYLHRQDPPIIHRDLKPSNILLGDRSGNSLGRVYLVDFGSVANFVARREGGTMTVVGTYGYMPPEQFGGRVVPASDLYSLGATLIYLMSGLHPTEIPQKEFRLEFRSLVNLDETFADWLSWMTEPSLDLRLSSAEEALRALERPRAQLCGFLRDRFRSLLPATRPRGSGVTVRKTGHFIEILFPPRGMGFILIGGLSAMIPIAFYVFMGVFPNEARGVAGVIVLAIALAEFFFCFRRVGWRIDARDFSVVNELLGCRVGCSPTFSREKFDSLFRHAIANSDEPEAVLDHLARAMNLQGSVAQLLEEERAWLAAELSDWLNGRL